MRVKMLTVFLCVVLVTSEFGLTQTSPIDCDLRKQNNVFIDVKYHFTGYDKDVPPASDQDVALDDINKEMTAMLEQFEPSRRNCSKTNHHRHHEHERPILDRQSYYLYTTLTKIITVVDGPIEAETGRPTGTTSNETVDINQNKTTVDPLDTATYENVDTTTDLMLDTSTNVIVDTTTDAIFDTTLNTEIKIIRDNETKTNTIMDLSTEVSPLIPPTEPTALEDISMIDCSQESGYSYFPNTGSCYKPYKKHQTWNEARSKCLSEGADLLVINTEFEDKVIKNIIKNFLLPEHEYFRWFWVGIQKDENEVYNSVHGDNMTEIFNVWKHKHNRNCVTVHESGQFEDAPCDYTYGFICEKSFDSGYLFNSDTESCYKPYKEHQTWSEARSKCLSEGADLLVINTEFEDNVIKDIINNFLLPQHEYFRWFWVGITKDENDVFLSTQGENMNEIFNVWKYRNNRECVTVHEGGKLEDAPCDYTYGFICEKMCVPV